jgi:hypothetical protein
VIGQLVFPAHASAAEPDNFYTNKQIAPIGSVITIMGDNLINANYFRIQSVRQPPTIFLEFEIPLLEIISDNEIRLTLPSYEILVNSSGGYTLDNQYRIRLYQNSNSYTVPYLEIDLYEEDPYSAGNGRIPCSTQGYFTVSNYEVISQTYCEGAVVIPEGVTSIGYRAFYQAAGITALTISNSVTSIGDEAFRNVSLISTVNLPNSITTLGSGAFSGTTALAEINFPDSLTSIGTNAFAGSGLRSVSLTGPNVTLGAGSFEQMGQLHTVVIGSGVSTIPDAAFYNNFGGSIQNLTLGNSITSIGAGAFLGARITSLVIPDSVTTISGVAFSENVLLKTIEIGQNVSTMDADIFSYSNLDDPNARIYYCGLSTRPRDYAYDVYPSGASCSFPASPTIGIATPLSPTSAAVSFTAPNIMGGQNASSYNVSVWDENLLTLIKTQVFSSGLPSRGQPTTVTVTGLTKSSTYKFKVAAVNSQGPSTESAATNLVATAAGTTNPGAPTISRIDSGDRSLTIQFTAGSSGGGTINGYKYSLNNGSLIPFGNTNPLIINNLAGYQQYSIRIVSTNEVGDSGFSNTVSTTTLDSAQDKAKKDSKELSEILSLVPTIAGLAQGIAGLSNSLLLPQKCVKGKTVKKVKAGAKCPKGYKVKK